MPRQIIDTESGRPRYVRRVVLTSALIVVLAALLVYLAYVAFAGHRASGPGGGNTPSARVSWQPSITPEAVLPGPPKESPCFVA
jgi:hypothetical protein